MTATTRPRRIPGHALLFVQEPGNYRWACRCGMTIKDPSAGRALARDVYRFHLLDVWMASWDGAA